MDRREFLTTTAVVGGGMVLGFWLPPAEAQTGVSRVLGQPWYHEPMVPEINAWITIAPDDTVTIRVAQVEMGSGVFTSNPMIVAEELQCDWTKVRAEYASPNRNVREKAPEWTLKADRGTIYDPNSGGAPAQLQNYDGVYRRMGTYSSGSVREGRHYMQMAGAEARERLLLAASTMWGVPTSALVAKDSVITHAASGRRTTYGVIAGRAAQTQLADPSKIRIKGVSQFKLIGTEQKNFDVPLKVTGEAMYATDVRLPGMLYAAAKACPVWGGDIRSYDFNAIRNMPGVHSAVKFGGRGHTSGGVAVVADTWWRAKTALDKMPIEWDLGPNGTLSTPEMQALQRAAIDDPNAEQAVLVNEGNVEDAMRRAAKIVEATYIVPYLAHAPMEPASAVAIVTPQRIDMWTGSQHPDSALTQAAREAGIAPESVYVHGMFLGGGYGITNGSGRSSLHQQVVAIARTLNGRPVKLTWTREEDWGFGARPRPQGIGMLRAGLDAQGWPIALDIRTSGDYSGEMAVRGLTAPPYYIPNYHFNGRTKAFHVPYTQRRATGSSINCFYLESFIDELAHATGKDPLMFRRELVSRNPQQGEGIGGFGQRNGWLTALDMVAKMSEWGKPLPEGWARGVAVEDRRRTSRAHTTICAEVHKVEISRRGQLRLHRVDIAFDTGFTLVNPLSVRKQIEGQIAWGYDDAMYQELTIKDGRAVETNFDTYPVSRMNEYPREVNIQFFKTEKWLYGTGEEAIPQIAPAIANAVFKVTGKRLRTLPLKHHDLSWG